MGDFSLSSRAESDLTHFYKEGVERFGEAQADKFFYELYDAFAMLAEQAGMGTRFVIEGQTFRKWQKGPYALIYKQRGNDIGIVRIFDTRSDYERYLTLDYLQDE